MWFSRDSRRGQYKSMLTASLLVLLVTTATLGVAQDAPPADRPAPESVARPSPEPVARPPPDSAARSPPEPVAKPPSESAAGPERPTANAADEAKRPAPPVHKFTEPLVRTEPLSPRDNPFAFEAVYELKWHNPQQRQFGAQFRILVKNPKPTPYWLFNFQFGHTGTRIDQTWSPWNLTLQDDGWYKSTPLQTLDGAPPVPTDGTTERAYSFNGRYIGNNITAIFPNGYRMAPSTSSTYKTLSAREARVVNRNATVPTMPEGEFNRQTRSAAGSTNNVAGGGSVDAVSGGEVDETSATSAGADSGDDASAGGQTSMPLVGACIVAGMVAIGGSVVGIAAYTRRQDRNAFRAKQEARTLERANTKTSFLSLAAQQESLPMPEPSAINNHSAAARAAAGAVIIEDVNAEQAAAEAYYVMEDVAPNAQHYQADTMPNADQYNDDAYYAEYDAELHQSQLYAPNYNDNYQTDNQMEQRDGVYETEYVEGLPEYAVQYGDEVDYTAVNQGNGSAGNNAIEHVDLHPPVAQEYYVADAIAYDDEEQDLGLEPTVHGEYHGQLDAVDDYSPFEATEFEATEFDAPYDPHHNPHHNQTPQSRQQ